MKNLTILRLRPMLGLLFPQHAKRCSARTALRFADWPTTSRPLDRGSIVSSAPCASKPAAQPKPPTKPGTGCAAATNTSKNFNNTAASRYADSEAQKRMDIRILEHRLRARTNGDRSADSRDQRARLGDGSACPIATIALVVATLSAAK